MGRSRSGPTANSAESARVPWRSSPGPAFPRRLCDGRAKRLTFDRPRDLDLVRLGERLEPVGRDGAEDHIREPGLADGPGHEQCAGPLDEAGPPQVGHLREEAPRLPPDRGRSHHLAAQPEDGPDQRDGLHVERHGGLIDEGRRSPHPHGVALPGVECGDEIVEGIRHRHGSYRVRRQPLPVRRIPRARSVWREAHARPGRAAAARSARRERGKDSDAAFARARRARWGGAGRSRTPRRG